ncbi:DNA packaging protein [Paracoccus aestuarii]|uniref:DNA packaging protein n=2 Tax=Paracoccus aestuarii TaxID=453842 RepID=A0A419A278_9RHOB|nr:DNA packaging protein [Paracoccus aestuarii]
MHPDRPDPYSLDALLGLDDLSPLPVPPSTPVQPSADKIETGSAIPGAMTQAEIAAFLNLATSQVRTKTIDGILVKAGRARWDVRRSTAGYIARLQQHASRAGRPPDGGDDLKAEKLRLTRAQADKEETRVRREAGELVEAAAVTREWSNLLRDVRNALLAVPSRCGAALPHLTATDIATLDREIRKALEGLADGN